MDFKTVRQTMTVNETVFNATGEIPVDEDFVLPDFYPEIIKVLKCKAVARVASKGTNGTTAQIDGHICITLLYCDKNGCLRNYEHIAPFSKVFEANEDISGGIVKCKIKPEYINSRAVTERKAAVHGAFSVSIQVKVKKQHDIIVDIDDDTVQTSRGEYSFLNAISNAEKNYVIEQELELSGGQQTIESIIRCDAFPVITEIKAVRNKAAVKGNLTVSLLYSDGKQCIPYKSVIPFSQFIDIQGISEECVCTGKVQLCFLEVKPRSIDGEWRSMMLTAKLSISVETFCEGEVPVIKDAYSTKYELEMERRGISLEKILGHISDSFMFKKTIELPRGALGSVIDTWSENEIESCTFNNGVVTVKGYITVCILVYDKDGRAGYFEKKEEFTFEKSTDYSFDGALICSPVIEPVTSSYAILSDTNLEYRIEYRINLSLCEEKKVSLLTNISPCEGGVKSKNDCSLIIYFAAKGENIWDIAKKYNTDLREMIKINSLEGELLGSDCQLLIPLI